METFENAFLSRAIGKLQLIVFVWTSENGDFRKRWHHSYGRASLLFVTNRLAVPFLNRCSVYVWMEWQVKTISKTVVCTRNIWCVFMRKRIRMDKSIDKCWGNSFCLKLVPNVPLLIIAFSWTAWHIHLNIVCKYGASQLATIRKFFSTPTLSVLFLSIWLNVVGYSFLKSGRMLPQECK